MQITIVQAEIETAIRNYILSQLSIRAGMDISIELQATRGAEGYRAMINVTNVPVHIFTKAEQSSGCMGQTTDMVINALQTTKTLSAALTSTPNYATISSHTPQTPAEVSKLMNAQYDAEDKLAALVETNQLTPEAVAELTAVSEAITEQAEVLEAAIVDAPVLPKKQSLFTGLKKPVNV